ncbi:MAG: hypothetical protein QXH27_04875 [Candidatus Micrarchaeia archaeon]
MEKRVYECPAADFGRLKTLLGKDPYAPVSFARQGYVLKEGKAVGGEAGKYYVQLKGEADFFKWAEEKFKELPNVKRAPKEMEEKIIKVIEEEESAAESGFGSLFG